MMRIPQVGDRVNYVLQAENKEEGTKAEYRLAFITKVWSYDLGTACVNLTIALDGTSDESKRFEKVTTSMNQINNNSIHPWFQMTSVMYSKDKQQNSFHYPDFTPHYIAPFTVNAPITHGREIIREGAVGIFDSIERTIMFNRDDVQNMHRDQVAIYDADQFFDQHAPRLDTPDDMPLVLKEDFFDHNKEKADERRQLVNEMILHHHRTGKPAAYFGKKPMLNIPADMMEAMFDLFEKFLELEDASDNTNQSQRERPQRRRLLDQRNTETQAKSEEANEESRESEPVHA